MSGQAMLDPLLAPALKMAERPVIKARERAERVAERIVKQLEQLAALAEDERDHQSQLQLTHVMEALGACTISLAAYARGVVPKVASQKPDSNIILG